MTTDILRRAATLMRERAEAATAGRWEASSSGLTHPGAGMDVYSDLEGPVVADCCGYQGGAGIQDAEHIASWHPAVALAVADWLQALVEAHEETSGDLRNQPPYNREVEDALAVARAYLGQES